MSDNKGSALIFTLMVILILSVLGIVVLEMSLYEYKTSYAYGNNISANYSAEAGLDIAKGAFTFNKEEMDNIKNIMNNTANKIISEYQKNNLPLYPEVLYQAIYNAVRKYLEDNVINNNKGKLYILNSGDSNILNQTQITNINIIDNYTYNQARPLPKFTIAVRTEGTYNKLKRYGNAILIFDLNDGNPLSIKSWTINSTPSLNNQ